MKKSILLLSFSASLFWACNNTPREAEEASATDTTAAHEEMHKMDYPETYEQDGLKIYPASKSPEYPGATLNLIKPESGSNTAAGPVAFEFSVENYELAVQTEDASTKGLANSDKGQHIHLIVDNSPYSAHYMPGLEKEFEPGNHYAIAFLSRSYHESVKSPGAAQVFQFSVGDADKTTAYDLSQPMLFYSRPKGEYKGADTKAILFDFYLHNVDLMAGGKHVRLTINGKNSFDFDTWQPYVIEGLPMGENNFTIELLDENDEAINPEINKTTRTFTLLAE